MIPDWLFRPIPAPSSEARQAAIARQEQLTKPPGSLGRLETLAVTLAGLQGRERPQAGRVWISVFAADHGVAAAGVSAFPQAVTLEMVRNFSRGGAAINVLARGLGADLEVVDVGVLSDPGELPGLVSVRVAAGTASFVDQPAMTAEQMAQALDAGAAAAERAHQAGAQIFVGGEMGIGNTTAASAMACALLARPAADLVGPGTGLRLDAMLRKQALLERALEHHAEHLQSAGEILRRLGGFEIAALAGAFVRAAQLGMVVLVDGFIATAAALAATELNPGCGERLLLAHASAEPGHRWLVEALGQAPLLNLGMRLGEGSGAALAVHVLRQACALHNEMATFAEAGVSTANG